METVAPRAAVIIGAGDATGGALVRRFAAGGFAAVAVRRTPGASEGLVAELKAQGHVAHALAADARDEEAMVALFHEVERGIGPVEAMVFNVGANVPSSILDETARKYRKIWEMACLGGFLAGREAARRMVARGRGFIGFTGATASLRGAAGFAAFAGAKHALRALAQSMARELGPRGIHVAHVIVDGAIDTAFIRERFPDRYATRADDGILRPESIAETFWQLAHQPRDAWTFETDLRPWMERW
jgi:NAD(P)-dependent dehydrogenase (short-subunit alcohol dehydrogenase family)